MAWRVCAFTDTYLPTINGVTYTVNTWRHAWRAAGGQMDVVYPNNDGYDPEPGEHPVPSIPFPFYDGYRLGAPTIPHSLGGVDIVHAHTPFTLGLAGVQLARQTGRPLVASFHTPTEEYTPYLADIDPIADGLVAISRRYQRWFFDRAEVVIAPSATAGTYLRSDVGVGTSVEIVSNGVDLDVFTPDGGATFRERYDLQDGPLIGYTGRHGHEKRLEDLVRAVALGSSDWTLVLGGEGPASPELQRLTAKYDVDARFLGFLDRAELPGFYAGLDVFAFPSPVETQGLVALESMACGTPVVGVDAGALTETIADGETGILYPRGDIEAFAAALERAITERSALAEGCLARRDRLGIAHSMDELERIYADVAR